MWQILVGHRPDKVPISAVSGNMSVAMPSVCRFKTDAWSISDLSWTYLHVTFHIT